MCSAGKIKEGNFEHFFNFDAILKLLHIFLLTFFSLRPKEASYYFNGLTFLWQVFKITRTTADFEQYFVFYIQYKSELQHQGGNIEHIQSYNKAGRSANKFRA
jgi:hypothetical protein